MADKHILVYHELEPHGYKIPAHGQLAIKAAYVGSDGTAGSLAWKTFMAKDFSIIAIEVSLEEYGVS